MVEEVFYATPGTGKRPLAFKKPRRDSGLLARLLAAL